MTNALAVTSWPVERLAPYGRNARTHSDDQVTTIAASIAEFGFNNPVLVDEQGEIIAGHGRLSAAQRLGLVEVPVIVLGHLSEAQKRAFRLADNRIALDAGWDEDLLAAELHALNGDGFDLALTGFSDEELDELLAPLLDEETVPSHADEEAVPEPQPEAVTRPGDLWCLGEHRLFCGDSRDAGAVERLIAGKALLLMVTDPPYGVNDDPDWRNRSGLARTGRTGKVANDDIADWREVWSLFPGDVAYIWHGGLHAGTVGESLRVCGFELRAQIIWAKPRFAIGRGAYHWQHEPCWYAVRKNREAHWAGDRKQTTLWAIGSGDAEEDAPTAHGTQKPVDCMRKPILNHTREGERVFDPFLGSGTTLIAAETTGRSCLGLEIDPVYADVAIRRWQSFTGRQAVLEENGRSFDDIVPGRAA